MSGESDDQAARRLEDVKDRAWTREEAAEAADLRARGKM